MAHLEKVIVLIDMDCFYCQVEEQLNPRLINTPIAVVQYNPWRGGGIIAVNYLARELGVTRHMRGDDAQEKCPNINLVRVPQVRGKADLTKYRDAGKRVADVLQSFTTLLERASIDEAYLDLTDLVNARLQEFTDGIEPERIANTFIVGYETNDDFLSNIKDHISSTNNIKLAVGAVIVEEIRASVYQKTGYKCSAGIAHNKILAKLVCSLHKPNKQTVLPDDSIPLFYENLPITKIKSLGGKLGHSISRKLGITNMSELNRFTEKQLRNLFDEKTGTFLYNIGRGIDMEPVTTRLVAKSIGCCKRFPGKTSLKTQSDIDHWLLELAQEISERLQKDIDENKRKAKQMIVSFSQLIDGNITTSSRTHPLQSYETQKLFKDASDVVKRFCIRADGSYHVTFLGISIGGFEEIKKVREITSFFKATSSEKVCKSVKNISPYFQKVPNKEFFYENNFSEQTDEVTNNNSNATISLLDNFIPNGNDKSICNISNGNKYKDDNSNHSVWSTSTIDLNEDPNDLIFYQEVPTCQLNENEIKHNVSNCSEDSISGEAKDTVKACPLQERSDMEGRGESNICKPSHSFFKQYFAKREEDVNIEFPVKRDFDTSKILDFVDSYSSEEECNNEEVAITQFTERNEVKCIDNDKFEDSSSMYGKEECSKCKKLINREDFISHMDYHYALEIVKEEAVLYQVEPTVPSNVSEKNSIKQKTKNGKRKHDQKLPSIVSFLQKEVESEEGTEICNECNRRVNVTDISSHLDYHTAKKLQREFNSRSEVPAPVPVPTKTERLGNNKKSKSSQKETTKPRTKTLHSFFK